MSAKDATNVDPAFGHVALAAFEHFKEIKALQEQELMKGAASARIDLGAAERTRSSSSTRTMTSGEAMAGSHADQVVPESDSETSTRPPWPLTSARQIAIRRSRGGRLCMGSKSASTSESGGLGPAW